MLKTVSSCNRNCSRAQCCLNRNVGKHERDKTRPWVNKASVVVTHQQDNRHVTVTVTDTFIPRDSVAGLTLYRRHQPGGLHSVQAGAQPTY